jgi:hypothetical protein
VIARLRICFARRRVVVAVRTRDERAIVAAYDRLVDLEARLS